MQPHVLRFLKKINLYRNVHIIIYLSQRAFFVVVQPTDISAALLHWRLGAGGSSVWGHVRSVHSLLLLPLHLSGKEGTPPVFCLLLEPVGVRTAVLCRRLHCSLFLQAHPDRSGDVCAEESWIRYWRKVSMFSLLWWEVNILMLSWLCWEDEGGVAVVVVYSFWPDPFLMS